MVGTVEKFHEYKGKLMKEKKYKTLFIKDPFRSIAETLQAGAELAWRYCEIATQKR